MDLMFGSFMVMLFAATSLLVEGAYLWWSGTHGSAAQRVNRRLNLMTGGVDAQHERISILKQRRFAKGELGNRMLQKVGLLRRLDHLMVHAGLGWSVAQFLAWSAGLGVLGLALAHMWPGPPAPKVVVALMFLAVPFALVRRARRLRLLTIERQLPEAADFLARALRAGHSFTNVLAMVGSELPEPLAGEFRTANQEINYGVPLNDALQNMAERIPLADLRYLVIAVLIQRESGGNLAEILGSIAHIIRERLKLIAQVRVLSAEGRMSAWILGLLPFCVMFVMKMTNPQYVSLLWTDPVGVKLLWYGAAMLVVGVLWLRRVIRIHV
ncbi:MAG: type II secretion system F family protein [Pseudomonadota bacterium]